MKTMHCVRVGQTSLALACILLISAACASHREPENPTPPETLVLENATADLVRVYVQVADRLIPAGRAEPMKRTTLRIARGALPPGAPAAMIVVVPVGTPIVVGSPNSGLLSEPYRVPDLIGMAWRYSGSRIDPLGPKL